MASQPSKLPSPTLSPDTVVCNPLSDTVSPTPVCDPLSGMMPPAPPSLESDSEKLALISALLAPLAKLEKLVAFEEARCATTRTDSCVLPGLISAQASFREALETHGVAPIRPAAGDALCPTQHELAMRRSSASHERTIHGQLVVRECHRDGLRYTPTGEVLRKAVVVARPSPRSELEPGASAARGDGSESANGELVHELQRTDTLQGLALRYKVSPSAITRLNRLPAGHQALHLRTEVRIPAPTPLTRCESTSSGGRGSSFGAVSARPRREPTSPASHAALDSGSDDVEDEDEDEERVPFNAHHHRAGHLHSSTIGYSAKRSSWPSDLSALVSGLRWSTTASSPYQPHDVYLNARPISKPSARAKASAPRSSARWVEDTQVALELSAVPKG